VKASNDKIPKSYREAKRRLLLDIATILEGDDDLFPEDLVDESKAYKAWDKARNDLVDEFMKRAGQ
jgi:hypothetical protein